MDRIEKSVLSRAPLERVWRAVGDSKELGAWLFSFRWHPFAIDPNVDYSKEPTTLVEFRLSEEAGGTRLVITETGFDRIPLERRAKAFTANEEGWEHQSKLVEKHVTR